MPATTFKYSFICPKQCFNIQDQYNSIRTQSFLHKKINIDYFQQQTPAHSQSMISTSQQYKSQVAFTPTQDLKLLWTKHYYPQATWIQIEHILKAQFSLEIPPQFLKLRFQEYLNVPSIRVKALQDENREQRFDFIQLKRKTPEQFLSIYREIKRYRQSSNTIRKQQTYEKEVIKKELYPDLQAQLIKLERHAADSLQISDIQGEFQLLRYKEIADLGQEEASKLAKIQKVKFKVKQLRLQNQRNVSKLYRVIRNLIQAETKHFASQIILNQINISRYLLRVLKNIQYNVCKLIPQLAKLNFQNIEHAYSEAGKVSIRKIIKCYYFVNGNDKIDEGAIFRQTSDGERVSDKRLILIMKMFRHVQASYLATKHKIQKGIMAQISEIDHFQFSERSSEKAHQRGIINQIDIHGTASEQKKSYNYQNLINVSPVVGKSLANNDGLNQTQQKKQKKKKIQQGFGDKNANIRNICQINVDPGKVEKAKSKRYKQFQDELPISQITLMHGEPRFSALGLDKSLSHKQNQKEKKKHSKVQLKFKGNMHNQQFETSFQSPFGQNQQAASFDAGRQIKQKAQLNYRTNNNKRNKLKVKANPISFLQINKQLSNTSCKFKYMIQERQENTGKGIQRNISQASIYQDFEKPKSRLLSMLHAECIGAKSQENCQRQQKQPKFRYAQTIQKVLKRDKQ